MMVSLVALCVLGSMSAPTNPVAHVTLRAAASANGVDSITRGTGHGGASHLRIDNDRIAEVVTFALTRSPSFGHLVATLESLDPVVYVQEGRCQHREQQGCLQLLPTPRVRNLLVRIDPRQPIHSVVAQLAHELYHALEIAREPDVVDAVSLRGLYSRIGERRCVGDSDECWESRAAVAFEALVMREIATPAARRTGSSEWGDVLHHDGRRRRSTGDAVLEIGASECRPA